MASPFHAPLETHLLDYGGEPWATRDGCEATAINGGPGSGKTSASAKAIRKAFLRAGMGGTFLCAKADEAEMLIADIRAAGRADDLVVIDQSGKERFNVLDYAARTLGGPGFEGNIVEVLRRMNEAARIADPKASGDGGENRYFDDGAMKWASHALPLLLMVEGTIRLSDLNDFITSLPNSPADVEPGSAAFGRWSKGYCYKVLRRAHEIASAPDASENARRLNREHSDFFTTEIPNLDNRPRSSIASTLTNLIYPFLSGKLAELFTTHTTITPDACRDGKIVVLDLPPIKYGAAGIVAQSVWKYLFGIASQNNATPNCRPIFLYADEIQNFLAPGGADADFLAMARSSKICTVFITQDYPTYFSKLGEEHAKRLLGMFCTRIFHANNSYETNLAASEIIGKVQKFHVGENQTTATNTGGGQNQHGHDDAGFQGNRGRARTKGQSSSGYLDYEIPPDYFATKLRTGTKRNGFKVDAIVVRSGRIWKRTGRHWVKAEFDQRA